MIEGLYECFNHWHIEGTLWIYSDPHFGDKHLAAEQLNRPSDEEQVRLINSKVGKKDVIIFLGDIGDTECVRKIRGYKVLIMGNHDAGRTNYERIQKNLRFDDTKYTLEQVKQYIMKEYPNWKYVVNKGYGFHIPFTFWNVVIDNRLFDEVYEGPLMIGEKLILSHEPVEVPWAFNIHGHDHSNTKRKNHLNVCAEAINFTPVNMNQFMKSGALAKIETIRRETINKATKRKMKREK